MLGDIGEANCGYRLERALFIDLRLDLRYIHRFASTRRCPQWRRPLPAAYIDDVAGACGCSSAKPEGTRHIADMHEVAFLPCRPRRPSAIARWQGGRRSWQARRIRVGKRLAGAVDVEEPQRHRVRPIGFRQYKDLTLLCIIW